MLPEACQHGGMWEPQLPLFSKKVWDFLVAGKSLERWDLSPIWIYNLSFSPSHDFGILRISKTIFPPIFFASVFIIGRKGGKGRRHRLKFYFTSVWAVWGKKAGNLDSFLLIVLTHIRARLSLAPKAEPIMVAIYWKTWWNKILKADSPWCSEWIKIYFSSSKSMN